MQLKAVPLGAGRVESERHEGLTTFPADATVVVLVYVNQTVQARHVFTADKPLDDAAIRSVLTDVNKMIGTK